MAPSTRLHATARWAPPIVLLVGAAVLALLLPPLPQDPAYHRFADARPVVGVPSGLNVLSNVPFLLVGAAGLGVLLGGAGGARFRDPRERWPYAAFFGGLLLTGLGSAWYHLHPDNHTLVWDRLPLAATVMALLAAVIAERIAVGAGLALLAPLVALGIGSVLHWYWGELRGAGDLRPYGLVQFYPLVAIPWLLTYPARYSGGWHVGVAAGLYLLAKVAEGLDRVIFSLGALLSGHTLKHLLAALAGYWVLRMLRTRQPV